MRRKTELIIQDCLEFANKLDYDTDFEKARLLNEVAARLQSIKFTESDLDEVTSKLKSAEEAISNMRMDISVLQDNLRSLEEKYLICIAKSNSN